MAYTNISYLPPKINKIPTLQNAASLFSPILTANEDSISLPPQLNLNYPHAINNYYNQPTNSPYMENSYQYYSPFDRQRSDSEHSYHNTNNSSGYRYFILKI